MGTACAAAHAPFFRSISMNRSMQMIIHLDLTDRSILFLAADVAVVFQPIQDRIQDAFSDAEKVFRAFGDLLRDLIAILIAFLQKLQRQHLDPEKICSLSHIPTS